MWPQLINLCNFGPGMERQWWLNTGTNLVPLMRHKSSDFVNSAAITSPAGGRTYLFTTIIRGINQDGLIRSAWVWVLATGAAPWKLKVFRPNGANYDFVSETSFTPTATGLVLYNFSVPVTCQPGDRMAIYLPENAQLSQHNTTATNKYNYADGDITTTSAFTDLVGSVSMNVCPYGYQPWLVAVGDSIFEGHNTASNWHSTFDTTNGPSGNPTAEIWNQMRATMPGLEYQNWSLGSQTYNWANATGFAQAYTTYALKAAVWLLGAGVNDVSTGRTWAQVEADLDAIRARCAAGDLWLCEILPWTAGTDLQAATIRTFNANIAVWCAANNARLILCHDLMGQVRPSTGEIDDLKTAYNQDGVHLKQAGVNAYAAIIKAALRTVYL